MAEHDLAYISDLTTQQQSFKNPSWKSPTRRHKPLKNLLSDEQKRIATLDTNIPLNKQINYFTVKSPPSLRPTKKYCDITGLPTSYRSPTNRLFFYNLEVYSIVKNLGSGVDQQYLGLRNANVVLR